MIRKIPLNIKKKSSEIMIRRKVIFHNQKHSKRIKIDSLVSCLHVSFILILLVAAVAGIGEERGEGRVGEDGLGVLMIEMMNEWWVGERLVWCVLADVFVDGWAYRQVCS